MYPDTVAREHVRVRIVSAMVAPQPNSPRVVSSYHLGRVIGRGGMGVVYEATDTRSGTRVALKLLNDYLASDGSFRDRFQREAHVGALLRSPYTVQLLDYGVEDGQCYLVMKLVDGTSLRDLLRAGPLPLAQTLRIASHVARALEEAEARGVVHRDIKPDNVMIAADGTAQVLDFGIARQAGGLTLTATDAFVGTFIYSAPESAAGHADHRSDIYSLGVCIYHMLTGRPPFEGTMVDLVRQHQDAQIPVEPLAGFRPEVVEMVRRCTEKEPEARYQSASELAGVLEHLAGDESDSADAATGAADATVIEPSNSALALTVGPPRVRRVPFQRQGSVRYELTLRNAGTEAAAVRLEAADRDDSCTFSLNEFVLVPPRADTAVSLTVTPSARRWRGETIVREFQVSVFQEGHRLPLVAAGEFEDRPVLSPSRSWPVAGAAGVAIALVALFAVFASGGEPADGDLQGVQLRQPSVTPPAGPAATVTPTTGPAERPAPRRAAVREFPLEDRLVAPTPQTTPTETLAPTAAPAPAPTATPTPEPTAPPTPAPTPVVVLTNYCQGVSLKVTGWDYPDVIGNFPLLGTIDWTYVLPPNVSAYFIDVMFRLDAPPIPVEDIIAVYPTAGFSPDQEDIVPELFGGLFDDGRGMIADGAIHSTTSPVGIPPVDDMFGDPEFGFSWAPFIDPPYRLAEPPQLAIDFEVGGARWFTDSAGNCFPEHGF